MSFVNIIFTCKYTRVVSAVPPDSPCIGLFVTIVKFFGFCSVLKVSTVGCKKKTGTVRIKLTHFYNFSIV
jgi:hypothetical protein